MSFLLINCGLFFIMPVIFLASLHVSCESYRIYIVMSWNTEFIFEQNGKWSFYMLTNVMLQVYCMFSTLQSYSGLISLAFVKWTPYRCCLSDLTLKN